MAYKGKYTGADLEAALDKAKTAVQPSDLETMQATVAAAIASFEERLPQADD